jgi:hypothetical protein
MLKRACAGLALSAAVILLASCGNTDEPPAVTTSQAKTPATTTGKGTAPAVLGRQQVTVHVPEMTERLHLT